MKEKLIIITLSSIFLLVPSLLLAISAFLIFGHFWISFLISLGILFEFGQVSNMIAQRRGNLDIINLKTKLAQISSQQSVEISCSYCKERNIVPIRLDLRNEFDCKSCKKSNLVIFQFASAQITTPLELPQLGTNVNATGN